MEDLSSLPPTEFTRRVQEMMAQACPDRGSEGFFNRNMSAAKALGMTYAEGLLFVIQKRAGLN